ncbi:MAG TPA: hypothetical protein PKY35_12620 [Candidatus Hydrogenedentes bacterium]|nr:hypothetical protein [Candidatus Hydrogenedentota bacterium]HOL77860.1 hypothetical protein [Candidatus Hydrogenedentota bacterium]HPO87025.1 hypothetical protein [Candidatus Hydrogenedentota bacterium]
MNKTKLHEGIALIEVSDPLLLTEIENDPVIRPYLGDRISDCCVPVMPHAVAEVQRRLQAMGHLPTRLHCATAEVPKGDQAV